MATFTYESFTGKQGVLVENGGGWTCTGFGSPCSQDVSGDNYGPITGAAAAGTSIADAADSEMYLDANIDLTDNEFAGATSMSYTIKWHAVAISQGGNPSEVSVWTYAGPINRFTGSIPYIADGTSVTYSNEFGSRLPSIRLFILASIYNFDGASVTLAFSGISFEIHDVVYGTTSTTPTPPSSSAAGSSTSALSSTSSISASATNNTTFFSSSTLFTTTISGQATIIQTIASQSPPVTESRSHLPSPSSSSGSIPLTVAELASVIAGSIIGVSLVLFAIVFWYQWRRRGKTVHVETALFDRVQKETYPEARTASRNPGVPFPYRRQPPSRPSTMDASFILDNYQETETSEVDFV